MHFGTVAWKSGGTEIKRQFKAYPRGQGTLSAFVVDASVAIKWFLPEIHSEAARRVLKCDKELTAPDILWPEVGNTVWKKVRRHEITPEEAHGILRDFMRFPINTFGCKELLEPAWALANRFDVSVYDGLYLALAVNRDSFFVTADHKFYDKLYKSFPGRKIVWVENVGQD